MNRKALFKLIIAIIIFILAIYFVHQKSGNNKTLEEQDQQRLESVKDFDANQNSNIKIIDATPDDITNGGEVILENRLDFINKFEDKDIGIAIANNLIPSSIKYIDIIVEDCTPDNISQYYKRNEDSIYNIFGIEDEESFKSFYNTIKDIGKLQSVKVNLDSIDILGNGANFTLELNDSNKQVSIPISSKVDKSTMNANFYIQDKR